MKTRLFKTLLLGSVVALFAGVAQAGSFKVLHSFVGGSGDGAHPFAGVTPAVGGYFYVATYNGGTNNYGTLSTVTKDGGAGLAYSFGNGLDGQHPIGPPIQWSFDGNVYGTTSGGGNAGCGTIYEYLPGSGGGYRVVYSFQCAPDAETPIGGLVDNHAGLLLGTAFNGGENNAGKVIYVNQSGGGGSLCYFSQSSGANPYAGITLVNGYLYTVTTAGGANNLGAITIFDASCTPRAVHDFAGGSDGAAPYGSLLFYRKTLYGTTTNGGGTNLGTVFRMNSDGTGYRVLHVFQGICCGSDGSFPYSGLTPNKTDGMLYGTTSNGGNATDLGTVFKIDPKTGAETVVHAFSGSDGAHPHGNLYIKERTIYGTTYDGGASNLGVVFKLKS